MTTLSLEAWIWITQCAGKTCKFFAFPTNLPRLPTGNSLLAEAHEAPYRSRKSQQQSYDQHVEKFRHAWRKKENPAAGLADGCSGICSGFRKGCPAL
ncbi:uncharacterized protein EAF02_004193 [Botrytis sinoallii]|uniref:uncharacterized protein n=1 Tax=Botrytis sinoallii TaxID=1463999 RepID=UPI001902550D|nr:uncharacterized protein EAF02_004193 [Botrytis sinoallii]KAF7885684.1 hypothetical protein EAF02_004193 [Botrytis sinoallii]